MSVELRLVSSNGAVRVGGSARPRKQLPEVAVGAQKLTRLYALNPADAAAVELWIDELLAEAANGRRGKRSTRHAASPIASLIEKLEILNSMPPDGRAYVSALERMVSMSIEKRQGGANLYE